VIWFASTLLALDGVFAERAMSAARADRQRAALGIERPARRFRPPSTLWSVIAGGVGALVVAGPVLAAAVVAAAVTLRQVIARRRRASGRRRAGEQLADAVAAIAAGLRAGGSLVQAFAYARDEADEPLRSDLSDLVERIDLGTPVGEALSVWADVRDSEDVRLIAGVLDLHRRSGGDLPAVLDGVAATLRERRAAQRELRALTAQARLSGSILGLLPIAFFGFLLLTSRAEMLRALATPLGSTALAVGLGMELLAFLWIRRLVEVR
jgi:tight adherence protein B